MNLSKERETEMSKVRVAIAGVGNCANSLIQGVEYYKDADPDQFVPGLMHVELGGYHVRDIEFVAAFDVDATKVGQDLGKAMWAGHNNTIRFADVGAVARRLGRWQREVDRRYAPAHGIDDQCRDSQLRLDRPDGELRTVT